MNERVGVKLDGRAGRQRFRGGFWTFLLVVMLVALPAGNLHATVILSIGSPTCAASSTNPTSNPACTPVVSQIPDLGNGLSGIKFSMSPDLSIDPGAAGAHVTTITLAVSGIASGTGTVTAGTVIPFHYHFILTGDNQTPLDSYSVAFNISTASGIADTAGSVVGGPVSTGTINFPVSTFSADVTGGFSGTIALGKSINPGTNYFVTTQLLVNWTSSTGGNHPLLFSIPGTSLDVNAIPEPGTIGMAGGAIVVLIAIARRRKRTSRQV